MPVWRLGVRSWAASSEHEDGEDEEPGGDVEALPEREGLPGAAKDDESLGDHG